MTKPTLLILAAGMGSRYGGLKQIDPVGPAGETIIDYSIYDALRAGFGKLVFVIRHDFEQAFKEIVGARFEKRVPVEYVFQELDKLPPGFSVPAGRTKPWGTTHAILQAEDAIREPFAAINADDFYGRQAYQVLARHLTSGTPDYAMVGFILRNTLSEHGSVARGVSRVDGNDYLTSIVEMLKIEPDGERREEHRGRRNHHPAHRRRGGLDEFLGLHAGGVRAVADAVRRVSQSGRPGAKVRVLHPRHRRRTCHRRPGEGEGIAHKRFVVRRHLPRRPAARR